MCKEYSPRNSMKPLVEAAKCANCYDSHPTNATTNKSNNKTGEPLNKRLGVW